METVKAQTEPMESRSYIIKIVYGDRMGDCICFRCGCVLQQRDLEKNYCSCCNSELDYTRPMTTNMYENQFMH